MKTTRRIGDGNTKQVSGTESFSRGALSGRRRLENGLRRAGRGGHDCGRVPRLIRWGRHGPYVGPYVDRLQPHLFEWRLHPGLVGLRTARASVRPGATEGSPTRARAGVPQRRVERGDPGNHPTGTYVRDRTLELAATNARLLAEIEVRLEAEERLKESHRLLESNESALKQAHDELERRVRERTTELAETIRSLTALLKQPEVNIDMAKQVMALIDPTPPRHPPLPDSLDLFVTCFYFSFPAAGGDHFFVRTLGAGENSAHDPELEGPVGTRGGLRAAQHPDRLDSLQSASSASPVKSPDGSAAQTARDRAFSRLAF